MRGITVSDVNMVPIIELDKQIISGKCQVICINVGTIYYRYKKVKICSELYDKIKVLEDEQEKHKIQVHKRLQLRNNFL